jgi:hypothetical protein
MVEPIPVMVPTVPFPPAMPSTDQVTVVVVVPVTVAVKDKVEALAMVVSPGLRDTRTLGLTFTTAEVFLAESALLVAVMICVPEATGAV